MKTIKLKDGVFANIDDISTIESEDVQEYTHDTIGRNAYGQLARVPVYVLTGEKQVRVRMKTGHDHILTEDYDTFIDRLLTEAER